jgi:hypothetical protein
MRHLAASLTTLAGLGALGPCLAVELDPTLRVGGFVDAVGLVGAFDDNNRAGNAAFGPGSHVAPVFKASAELQVGGTVDEAFSYQIDYELANDGVGGTATRLEQAYVRWQIDEGLALKGGRFEDWIGLERNDSPTWYRTRLSPLAQLWHGIAPTGADVSYRPAADWRFDLYVVNGIWSETGIVTTGVPSKRSQDIGYGASARWHRNEVGTFTAGAAFDAGTMRAQGPGEGALDNTWSLFATAHYDGLKEDHGFFCFADVEYVDYQEFAGYGAMIGAVQALTPRISASVALTYVDPDDEDALQNPYNTITTGTSPAGVIGGTYGRDDELVECCVALTTRPTGSDHVRFNTELAYQDHAQTSADVAWLDLQLIVILP